MNDRFDVTKNNNIGMSNARENSTTLERLQIPFAGTYRLTITANSQSLAFVRLFVGRQLSRPLFIPANSHTVYWVKTHKAHTELQFDRSEVTVEDFRHWRITDFPKLLMRSDLHQFCRLDSSDLNILPLLSDSSGVEIARTMRTLAQWGFGISTANLQDTLLFDFEEQPDAAASPLPDAMPSIGIAIHLHYLDVWNDFEKRLARINLPFTPLITLTKENSEITQRIKARWPHAKFFVYPNRGRDVGPFIQLWRDGHLDKFDLLCKLHGKKTSAAGPHAAVLGEIWRKASLNDLIGSNEIVSSLVSRFAQQKNVGMIGSGRFHLPNKFRNSYRDTWSDNEKSTLVLAKAIGFTGEKLQLDFFAGTMFWIRPKLLDLLKPLNLSQDSFPEELGEVDGTLHHAIERLFGMLPELAKEKMTKVDSIWRPD